MAVSAVENNQPSTESLQELGRWANLHSHIWQRLANRVLQAESDRARCMERIEKPVVITSSVLGGAGLVLLAVGFMVPGAVLTGAGCVGFGIKCWIRRYESRLPSQNAMADAINEEADHAYHDLETATACTEVDEAELLARNSEEMAGYGTFSE